MKRFLAALLIASPILFTQAQSTLPSAMVTTMEGKKVDSKTFSNGGKPMIINF